MWIGRVPEQCVGTSSPGLQRFSILVQGGGGPLCGWGTPVEAPRRQRSRRRPGVLGSRPRWLVTAEPWRRLSRVPGTEPHLPGLSTTPTPAWRAARVVECAANGGHAAGGPQAEETLARYSLCPSVPLPGVWWAGTLTLGAGFQVDLRLCHEFGMLGESKEIQSE